MQIIEPNAVPGLGLGLTLNVVPVPQTSVLQH